MKTSKSRPQPKRTDNQLLREHLLNLLSGRGAHADFGRALAGLPASLRGARRPGLPFTPWRLLEHMRIAQWDILEFSASARHVSPAWPDEYWPKTDAPPNDDEWDASVAAFRRDLSRMRALVKNPKTNLFARIPHGDGQTILREALLVADHNSYHLGQFIFLRRLLGAWQEHS